jgi:hypothetical protein
MSEPRTEDELFAERLLTAGRRETPDPQAEIRAAQAAEEALAAPVPAMDVPAVEVVPSGMARSSRRDTVHRLRYLVGALSTAAALLLVGSGLFLKKQSDANEAHAAAAEAQRQDLQNQIDVARAEADKQAAAVKSAAAALSSAKDDAARAQAQHDLDIAMQKQGAASAAIRSVSAGTGRGKAAVSPACTCSRGDPLCGCIP